jgi:hypothetical protein
LIPWVAGGGSFDLARSAIARVSREFLHEVLQQISHSSTFEENDTYLHLTIDGVTSTNAARGSTVARNLVASLTATLAVGAVASHVTSVTTDAADDVGGEVALLGAVILAMTDLAACIVC